MKWTYVIPCLIFISFVSYSQNKLESTIDEVTVFTQGAQVSRVVEARIEPGESTLIFSGLSPHLDEKSVRVKGEGEFTVLSVSSHKNYLNQKLKEGKIKELQEEIKIIEDSINLVNIDINNIGQVMSFFENNAVIKGNEGLKKVDLASIGEYYFAEIQKYRRIEYFKRKEQRGLNRSHKNLENQLLVERGITSEIDGEIHVDVVSKIETQAVFEVSYYVPNAGWYPSYDIHVDDVNEPAEVTHFINVFQHTEENWDHVSISFSNGNPKQATGQPEMPPYYINERIYSYGTHERPPGINHVSGKIIDNQGEELIGAHVLLEGTTVGTVTDMNGYFKMFVPQQGEYLIVSYIGYESQRVPFDFQPMRIELQEATPLDRIFLLDGVRVQGISSDVGTIHIKQQKKKKFEEKYIPQRKIALHSTIRIALDEPYSIQSGEKQKSIRLKTTSLPANFFYKAIPKYDDHVYVNAHLLEWRDVILFQGEADLFFEKTFVGTSLIDPFLEGDSLFVSFGSDPEVQVNRKIIKKYNSKKFLGSKRTAERIIELEVINNKGRQIQLQLVDQVPVSQTDKIEIEIVSISGANLNDKDGKISWDLSVDPGSKTVKQLEYKVKYPKGVAVYLED